jgi:hypothetical protein
MIENFVENIDISLKSFLKVRLGSASIWLGTVMYV